MSTSLLVDIFLFPILIGLFFSISTFFILFHFFKKYFINEKESKLNDANMEVDSIAGDNVWSTKLDLARAYLEAGQLALSKSVMQEVANCSDEVLQNEAKQLLKAHF
jgi:FimV-like protein